MKKILYFLLCVILVQVSFSQNDDEYASINKPVIYPTLKLDGPRVGLTYLAPGESMTEMKDRYGGDINPFFSQFGWQFEYQYFQLPSGMAGMVEVVTLIGGLEQDIIIPSANLLVGLRTGKGFEFGFGPNLTLSGASFVIAAGFNITVSDVNFPVNFALVPSSNGFRASFLFGFNARKDKNSVHYN